MLVFTLLPLLALAYDAPGSGESVTFTEYPDELYALESGNNGLEGQAPSNKKRF